jgi:peptide/nickel transport system permease protein
MGRYTASRLLQALFVFIAATVIVFLMIHLAPGEPLMAIMGPNYGRVSPEKRAEIRHKLGLDRPLHVQYVSWLVKALRGDFGRSLMMRQEIGPMVWTRSRATAVLAAGALIFAVPLGIIAGVAAAWRRNSFADRLVTAVSTTGICTPPFFLGLALVIVFSLYLGWTPASGMHSVGESSLTDLLRHLVLPAITLGSASAAAIARMTRSSLLEVMAEDYIRTARAKGLSETAVTWKHAFRNAMVSVITVVGLEAGYMVGGAVLVEVVFSWPGLGSLMMHGILRRDFTVVQACVLVVAAIYVAINFIVDTLYAYIDPRIRVTD